MSAQLQIGVGATSAARVPETVVAAMRAANDTVLVLEYDAGESTQAPDLEALLFLIDLDVVADSAELETAMMNITAQINDLHEQWRQRRSGEVRVPVGIVITGRGELAGHGLDGAGLLVQRPVAYLTRKSLDAFIEGVCNQSHVTDRADVVRQLLQRLSMLLDFLMTLEIEFQIVLCGDVAEQSCDDHVHDLVGWVHFTHERDRSLRAASRLRTQFAAAVILVAALLAVPFVLDAWRVREPLHELLEKGVDDAYIAGLLEDDARAMPVQWLATLALPGTQAESTARNRTQLLAAWRAREFLRARVMRAPSPDSLQSWADKLGRGTPRGSELFVGWRDLPAHDREQVRDAVRAAVRRHGLAVAVEVERLLRGQPLRSGVDTSDPQRACERLGSSFVLAVDADPALRRLHSRLDRRCELLGVTPAERPFVGAADRWQEQIEDDFAVGAVTAGRIAQFDQAVPVARARGATSAAAQQRQREVQAVASQLAAVAAALEAQRAGDQRQFTDALDRLRSTPPHGLVVIEDWARQRRAESGR